MLLLRPDALAGAMQLRAIVPLRDAPKVSRRRAGVDHIWSVRPDYSGQQFGSLAAVLMNAGATVRTRALPMGPRAVADGFWSRAAVG